MLAKYVGFICCKVTCLSYVVRFLSCCCWNFQEKHAYLRSLGVKYITSSRSGNKFEADMKSFLEQEDAEGVDVILNSLSHDDYISRSLSFLKSGGRFIEIGKRGIWSHQCFGTDGVEQQVPSGFLNVFLCCKLCICFCTNLYEANVGSSAGCDV